MSEYYTSNLANGIEVVAEPLPGVQSVAFGFFIGAGARDETWDVAGLSHLTEATMFRGTKRMSSQELTDSLDRLGIVRNSNTGIEMSLFSAIQLGEHVLDSLGILAEVLQEPSFPPQDLEAVRGLQLQEIGQREDQPGQLVMDRARQLFFAGHPAGNDVLGTQESVSSITRDQVLEYWSARYTPNNIVFAVAGRFDWEAVLRKLEAVSEGWKTGSGRALIEEPAVNPAIRVQEETTAQENICMIFPGVPYGDSQYYAAALTSLVLGGGMNSRLATEVREKRGLAYSVGARFDGMEKTGLFRVYAGTQPDRARESVEVMLHELAHLERGGVTDEELDLAKIRLKSRLVMNSESTGNRAMSIGREWWYKRRFRSLREVREEIDAVDLGMIRDLLDRIRLTENVGLVALGPLSAADLGLGERAFEVPAAAGEA